MAIDPAPLSLTDTDGEQRRVTLMFADISGSTALVEHLDPEATANLLDPLMSVLTDTVERYAGSVSPRGDGILAMFGVSGAAEDNTVRACFAALEILRRLDGVGPKVRIGIHYGDVALLSGRRGPARENFFGPAIHAAARLEQTAEPGTACLSPEAYEQARDFVTAEILPPVEVKGLSKPLERYRLLEVRTASRWRARLGRGLTPMVNRRSELLVCAAAIRDATRPGLHLLQVLGAAGVGKSRLVHEALHSPEGRTACVIALTGAVHRAFAGYDPLRHWLHELALDANVLKPADRPEDLIVGLPGAARLSEDDRRKLVRYLGLLEGRVPGVADLDIESPLDVTGAIATIIVEMAAGRPVILSCEDAGSIDRGRLEHLAAVGAVVAARGLPVLMLVTARHAPRSRAGLFTSRKTLRVDALADEDARQLVARLHPSLHRRSKLVAPILAKADGNPLFLEEVAALLLGSPDEYPPGSDTTGAIPDRIDTLIADRLARLPREAQALLRVCSVLGTSFTSEILRAVTGLSDRAIREQIAKLKTERLIHEIPGGAEQRISFNHLLIRDVAYKTLLPSRRRFIHEQALRHLETPPGEASGEAPPRQADVLAHHAVNARLWPEALRYLQQDAVAAAGRADYATSERRLRDALKVAGSMPNELTTRSATVDIMLGLRALLALDLRHGEADQLLDQAEALAADLEPERRIAIRVRRVRTLNTRGQLRQAMAAGSEARDTAREIGHVPLQVAAMHFLGQTFYYMGRYDAGDTTLTEAVDVAPMATSTLADVAVGDPPVLVLAMRALTRTALGRFLEAEQDARQAIAIAAARESAYDMSFASLTFGVVRLQQRRLEEAEDALRAGLDSAERHNLRALLPLLNAGLGHTLLLTGSTNAAIVALSEAHEVAQEGGRVLSQAWAANGLAAAYGSSGGTIPGLRHAEEGIQLGARHGMRGFLVAALRGKGALLASSEDTRDAGIRAVNQALALARKLGMKPDIAHCLATLAAISDDQAAAAEAAAIYQVLGMSHWAERVLGQEVETPPISVIAA